MKKVLVVEDEISLQKAVTNALHKSGVDSYSATSAEEAKKHLETRKDIGAIWLDHYLLDQGTGLDFLNDIKKDPGVPNLPVFVVTNSVDDDKVRDYHSLGVENYYIKSDTSIYKVVSSVVEALETEEKYEKDFNR